jgi:4-hydroxy-2-oxoheptanedioate aldolase
MIYGPEYFKRANESVLVLGMIETPGAIAALDEILAVENLDGIYVGPNDLGIALGMPSGMDREEPDFIRVIENIARRANLAGKIPGIHTNSSKYAANAIAMGFGFVTVCSDAGLIAAGSAAIVRDIGARMGKRA